MGAPAPCARMMTVSDFAGPLVRKSSVLIGAKHFCKTSELDGLRITDARRCILQHHVPGRSAPDPIGIGGAKEGGFASVAATNERDATVFHGAVSATLHRSPLMVRGSIPTPQSWLVDDTSEETTPYCCRSRLWVGCYGVLRWRDLTAQIARS